MAGIRSSVVAELASIEFGGGALREKNHLGRHAIPFGVFASENLIASN